MFFNKNSQETVDKSLTSGSSDSPDKKERGLFIDERGLTISNRHATWGVSLAIIWSFFVFISGYFLGQRTILEQFATRLEQDSLSDKIYSSLCTLYEVDNEAEVTDTDASSEGEDVQSDTDQEQKTEEHLLVDQTGALSGVKVAQEGVSPVKSVVTDAKKKSYYAPLAGFGSAEHAYAFAQRCTKKNIKVVVKKKPSKSSKGRTHYWYQVVTHPYDDKKTLMGAIDTIKRAEHIRDIQILEA